MIYEMRTYRLKTGKMNAYLKLVEQEGIEIQKSHLGNLVAYFYTEIGPLDQVVHIWSYEDLEDRRKRRQSLMEDERWREFIPKIQALIEQMENKILCPANFSPLK